MRISLDSGERDGIESVSDGFIFQGGKGGGGQKKRKNFDEFLLCFFSSLVTMRTVDLEYE